MASGLSSGEGRVHPADMLAFEAMARVRPVLSGLASAGAVIDLPPFTLLHAGPPYEDGQAIPAPVANSVAAAAVFEGWAKDREDALRQLAAGKYRLAPAQDVGCVVPLAAVLSASQQVQIVRDGAAEAAPAYAPLNEGNGPAQRLGLPGIDVVARLRWLSGPFADAVRPAFERGLALLPIADQALVDGDDLHGRTHAATMAFARALALDADPRIGAQAAHDFIAASPGFFLNTWMAAVKCMMNGASGIDDSGAVIAMGANGASAGLKLAGRPRAWTVVAAAAPVGQRLAGFEDTQPLPAIGDSAVVEGFGLGAMAWSHSPEQQAAMGRFMPEPSDQLAQALLYGPHPGLPLSRAFFGLSARSALRSGKTPVVGLAMLDASGMAGRIGGGVWHAPSLLFKAHV